MSRKKVKALVSLKEGDKVKMVNCMEAEGREDKVWTCRGDEFTACSGDQVVFLKDFSGYFCREFLELIPVFTSENAHHAVTGE